MSQHSYTSSYPSSIYVDSGIKQFFEDFYKTSDTPDIHDSYADAFTADATLIMASRKCVGREEILTLRRSMWEKVSSRLHTPVKTFPFGAGNKELMLYGTVDYVLKDGSKANVDWAAKANMVKDGEKWKMEFYQVYLDTAAQQNAK